MRSQIASACAVFVAGMLIGSLAGCGYPLEPETHQIATKMAKTTGQRPAPNTLLALDEAVRITKLLGEAGRQSGYTDCLNPPLINSLQRLADAGRAPDADTMEIAATEAEQACTELEPALLTKVRDLAPSYRIDPPVDEAQFKRRIHALRVRALVEYFRTPPTERAKPTINQAPPA
jgi:hypothetical protein